ncbi:PRP24 (YMR268C) [Zygosaccharomyces parabailii]|nr:PRP24 (YMR268C) [Zygosaccharomyces parabailii]CDH08519.1 related to U4/U6 snRNA-associated-splicing factor PRP24 [Zygosaccharomyces bailii ISA1307]SJM88424.1 related to U4/U6 snRNA-associated-splicing factor PRP24 [Zygosaccharomyces bailii]
MKRQLDESIQHESKRRNDDAPHKQRELTTVVVSNLPKSYNQNKVYKYFQDCGAISHIDITESIDKLRRLARIEFTRYDEALSALTRSHKKIGNNEIKVTLLENCTVWVTNFPPHFNHRDIKNLFRMNELTVLSVRLPSLRFNADRRFAYVDVITPEEVAKAVERLDSKELEGYNIVVKQSNPLGKSKRSDASVWERREVLIRNLNTTKVTEDTLRQLYSKYGSIESIKISGHEKDNGYAFVSFIHQEPVNRALETNKMLLEGNEIKVTLADRKAYLERQQVKALIKKSNKDTGDFIVSLYPLHDKVNKAQLQKLVQEKAAISEKDIKHIYLVPDLRGSLIVFKDTKNAARCSLALNGIEFQRTIVKCGPIKDLIKNNGGNSENRFSKAIIPAVERKLPPNQLSNDDFRRLFLGK